MPDWSVRADPTRFVPSGEDPAEGGGRRKPPAMRWVIIAGGLFASAAVAAELLA
jgi:hypothetical protein